MNDALKGRRSADALFEEFWKIYPRRVGKLAARRAWDKARPTPELFERIKHTLSWQVPLWTDPQFVPHPSTWLNAGRWDDEAPARAEPSVNGSRSARWICEHLEECTSPAICRHKDAMPHKYPKRKAS